MPPVDTRRCVGGFVWAKAEAVSRDAKRVYGRELDNTWLRGTVLEVLTNKRNESSKRTTTYIKARYMVGRMEKEAIIPLASLKRTDPKQEVQDSVTNTGCDRDNVSMPRAEQEVPIAPPEPLLPPPQNNSTIEPVSCNNGRNWYDGITDVALNGPVQERFWKMTCQYTGAIFTPGCDERRKNSPYDYFMACFPKEQLKFMVEETSEKLQDHGYATTTVGELLKWFGVTILITRFEFGDRASLWSTVGDCKYMSAANLGGRTGMSRNRYDTLLQHIVWSYQPFERPEGMSSEAYRWMLVGGFVDRINNHRKRFMSPSSVICVDESISRWYGLGGSWINAGLPMYVAIDRKPEDGCEIQTCCCAKSGIMLQLKLVKTATEQQNEDGADGAVADANG
jgi:Transposase IS4